MTDPDMATWDACEPQYSQLPFYSSTLRSMVAVGTFFNVDQRIFRVVSHEIKVGEKLNTRVLLNEFVYFKESGITKAPIFSGAGRDHKELVQTRNGFYVSSRKPIWLSRTSLVIICTIIGVNFHQFGNIFDLPYVKL